MRVDFERTHDGRVIQYRVTGTLTREGIDAMMAQRYAQGVPPECKAYILDLTDAGFEQTGKEEILWLAEAGGRYRLQHGDTRATLLVAPENLQFGVAKMLMGFSAGSIPLTVYRSMADAVAAVEKLL